MTFFWVIILFGILIFFHELGHFIFAKLTGVKVLKFSLGFGPKLIGKKIGETHYVISAVPLGGYVKPLGEERGEEVKEEDKPRAFNFQPVWKRAVIVLAGPVFNLILAYIIFVTFFIIKLPIAIPNLSSFTTTIEDIVENSPAMKAGLKKNDTIVSINGTSVKDWYEMAEIFSKNPRKELRVRIKRGGDLVDVKVIPEPTKVENQAGEEIIVGRIGVKKQMNFDVIQSGSILQAPVKGVEAVYGWSVLVLQVVGKLLTGAMSTKQIGGPILIVDAAAKAASAGALTYFNFIAIISINLAIFNLLPIPLLDGGHLTVMSIEALRRKPLSEQVMAVVTKVGLAIIMLLIVLVFYNDIMRIIVPWVQKTLNP